MTLLWIQVMLLCGFILICEPLVSLLGYHILRYTQPSARKSRTGQILLLLKAALYLALGMGLYVRIQVLTHFLSS